MLVSKTKQTQSDTPKRNRIPANTSALPAHKHPDSNALVKQALGNLNIQAKLKISAPGDRYEQEADWVADQIMCMPVPGIQRKPT